QCYDIMIYPACCFFFQAEDGIRDFHVTGVQTCALPISVECTLQKRCRHSRHKCTRWSAGTVLSLTDSCVLPVKGSDRSGFFSLQIGRATCRESLEYWVVRVSL